MIIHTLVLITATSKIEFTGTVTNGKTTLSNSIVFIEGYGKATPLKRTIEQKNRAFIPHILAVPVGSTVSFPNMDTVYHNVFAEYNAKQFDLGIYPKGQTRTVTFDKPGLVSVLCNIHSNMSAYILVVDSAAYTVTDRNGNFTLKDIEAGKYTIKAWHESGVKITQSINVDSTNTKVSLILKK
jgi:plastocyanin